MTNNEAEYAGLLLGVELAVKQRDSAIIFVLDSQVVVGQMQGHFAVNSPNLRRWHAQARRAIAKLCHVQYCVVPRAYNALADALAREAGMPWADLRQKMEHSLPQSI